MTAFAFDYDGTISAAPDAFGSLMRALMEGGRQVFVITAYAAPNTEAAQRAKIAAAGFEQGRDYTDIVVIDAGQGNAPELAAAAQQKLQAVRDRGVVLYVDDRLDWCETVRPACQTLWVVPA